MRKNSKNESGPTLVGYTVVTREGLHALQQELLKGILNVSLKKDDVMSNLKKKTLDENLQKRLVIVEIKADENKVFNKKEGKFSVKGESKMGEIQPYEEALNEIGVTTEFAEVA